MVFPESVNIPAPKYGHICMWGFLSYNPCHCSLLKYHQINDDVYRPESYVVILELGKFCFSERIISTPSETTSLTSLQSRLSVAVAYVSRVLSHALSDSCSSLYARGDSRISLKSTLYGQREPSQVWVKCQKGHGVLSKPQNVLSRTCG